jgi:large subunit ribosomal protein L25
MKFYHLEAAPREQVGKKAAKAIRKGDGIPAVLYGNKPVVLPYDGELNAGESIVKTSDNKGIVVTNLVVTQAAVRNLIYTPEVYLVELKLGKRKVKAMVKDFQMQPVTDAVIHIDFQEIFDDKPIVIEVPVLLQGHSEGVKAGGKLSLITRKLKVKGLYKNIPERLVIDITDLELGKTIQVGSLNFKHLELVNSKDTVVCSVKLTRAVRGAAAEAADAAAAPAAPAPAPDKKQ